MRKHILSFMLIAMIVLAAGCSPRLRNNPFDFGSTYNRDVNAVYISAVSNIVALDAYSVTVKWDRNVQPNFYAYRIYGGTSSTVDTTVPMATITEAAVTTYRIAGLSPFTQYYFRVGTENRAGYASVSSVISLRTPPAAGGVISLKDPAVTEGSAKMYCVSAIDGYMFFGYRGTPSQYGGKGVGRIQNMLRVFYLPYWVYYDIDESDNIMIQYHANPVDPGAYGPWDLTYSIDWDTANSSLDNAIGSVFYANVLGGANAYVYYSDAALGYLYVMTNTAYNILTDYNTRKYYYADNGYTGWTTDITNFWKPTHVYGSNAWVNLGTYTGTPRKFKVEYSAAQDKIYFSTSSYSGGRIYLASPTDYKTFTSTLIYSNTAIDYDDLTSFAADTQNVYIIERTACRMRISSIAGGQDTIVGDPGSAFGDFNAPSDIDVYNGVIFVADTLNHRVQIFSTNGQFISSIGSFGTANNQFDTPVTVTVTSNDTGAGWDVFLLVADKTKIRYFNIDSLFN
ncbi:MAG: fibronectin type III domain-containing protein [Spirochaetota bacterium]